MSGCPFKDECLSHRNKLNNFPEKFVKLIEDHYCNSNHQKCARYVVGMNLGKEKIPMTLPPNQLSKVKKILKHR